MKDLGERSEAQPKVHFLKTENTRLVYVVAQFLNHHWRRDFNNLMTGHKPNITAGMFYTLASIKTGDNERHQQGDSLTSVNVLGTNSVNSSIENLAVMSLPR